jgi:hypothetical protein
MLKTRRRNRGSGLSIKENGDDDYDEYADDDEDRNAKHNGGRGSQVTTTLGGSPTDGTERGFRNINCAMSTASLWCRQVVRVGSGCFNE